MEKISPGADNALAGYAMATGATFVKSPTQSQGFRNAIHPGLASECHACGALALWHGGMVIWPPSTTSPAEKPHTDMPSSLLDDYAEAASIVVASPRGAAALLRLLVQKLCKELGEPGKNTNADIGSLVAKGLDQRIQKALDSIRVIGSEAVHPLTMDLRDDLPTALSLFKLVNIIVQRMISDPKHVDEIYNSLPKDKVDGIINRDT